MCHQVFPSNTKILSEKDANTVFDVIVDFLPGFEEGGNNWRSILSAAITKGRQCAARFGFLHKLMHLVFNDILHGTEGMATELLRELLRVGHIANEARALPDLDDGMRDAHVSEAILTIMLTVQFMMRIPDVPRSGLDDLAHAAIFDGCRIVGVYEHYADCPPYALLVPWELHLTKVVGDRGWNTELQPFGWHRCIVRFTTLGQHEVFIEPALIRILNDVKHE
jgi:hypothetical protein